MKKLKEKSEIFETYKVGERAVSTLTPEQFTAEVEKRMLELGRFCQENGATAAMAATHPGATEIVALIMGEPEVIAGLVEYTAKMAQETFHKVKAINEPAQGGLN